jgi:hypothetical protein
MAINPVDESMDKMSKEELALEQERIRKSKMSKNKIIKSELSKFLGLLTLKGEIVNNESICDFTKDTCKVLVRLGEGGGGALRGVLKSKFEEWGKIGISNLPLLSNFVNSFSSDTIELEVDKNKLKLSSPKEKLKISYILSNADLIKNKPDETNFDNILAKKGIEFILTKEQVKGIINYFSIIDAENMIVKSSGKVLTFKLKGKGTENDLEYSIDLEKEIGDIEVKFTQMLIEVLNTISNDVVIALTDNFAYLKTESKEYKVEYIVCVLAKEGN